eukprot:scaffold14349_cov101-Isochrysis_galbana.AAC.3
MRTAWRPVPTVEKVGTSLARGGREEKIAWARRWAQGPGVTPIEASSRKSGALEATAKTSPTTPNRWRLTTPSCPAHLAWAGQCVGWRDWQPHPGPDTGAPSGPGRRAAAPARPNRSAPSRGHRPIGRAPGAAPHRATRGRTARCPPRPKKTQRRVPGRRRAAGASHPASPLRSKPTTRLTPGTRPRTGRAPVPSDSTSSPPPCRCRSGCSTAQWCYSHQAPPRQHRGQAARWPAVGGRPLCRMCAHWARRAGTARSGP